MTENKGKVKGMKCFGRFKDSTDCADCKYLERCICDTEGGQT